MNSHNNKNLLTMLKPTLSVLYNRISKHSNYQILARPLQLLLPQETLSIVSRHEVERLIYILARQSLTGKVIADIGGNTGFFSIECAIRDAAKVLYFEGNQDHAEFVAEATRQLGLDDRIQTQCAYLNFDNDLNTKIDICFLLNVLHHIGDDFGDTTLSRNSAKNQMLASLQYLSSKTSTLIFQLGFNWKGDRTLPLFEHGSKEELIEFVRQGTASDWDILDIGIAERVDDKIAYQNLHEKNKQRDDSLGEFLNRPLFIMRSKHQ